MTGGVLQVSAAAVAAIGLHVAGFALVPLPGGVQAKGDGGDAVITLAATDAGLVQMVATWDAPPTFADVPMMLQPEADSPVGSDEPVSINRSLPAPASWTSPVLLPSTAPDIAPVYGEAPAPFAPPVRPKARPVPTTDSAPPAARTNTDAPAVKPTTQGAGTVAQVAAGSGGGAQAGADGQAQAGGQSGAAVADLKAEWGASIRARIERKKRYPAGADGSGTVRLRLTVSVDGRLQAVAVSGSSGNAALDAAALRAVNAAGRFAKAPQGVTGAANFTLNMNFDR